MLHLSQITLSVYHFSTLHAYVPFSCIFCKYTYSIKSIPYPSIYDNPLLSSDRNGTYLSHYKVSFTEKYHVITEYISDILLSQDSHNLSSDIQMD